MMPRKRMRILLFGQPGAGKGTQADLLSKKLRITAYSTGAILRIVARNRDKRGRKARYLIKNNLIAEPDFIFNILSKFIKNNNFILDGFPRNLKQLELCEERLPFDIAIYINIDKKEAIKRLIKRYVCKNCDTIYSISDINLDANICKNCGVQLVKRDDDTAFGITKRLKIFETETLPMLQYLNSKSYLFEVDGKKEANLVLKDILKLVSNLQ